MKRLLITFSLLIPLLLAAQQIPRSDTSRQMIRSLNLSKKQKAILLKEIIQYRRAEKKRRIILRRKLRALLNQEQLKTIRAWKWQ